jgi:hypothetical protein
LHGTYALQFDTQNKQVQVLIPAVFEQNGKPAHEYRAGFFLNEAPISPPSVLPVTPVIFGSPLDANNLLPDVVTQNPVHDDPKQFVILRQKDLAQAPDGPLRNLFQLPYPRSLRVLRAQELIDPDHHSFFDNTSLIPKLPNQVPLSITLQYALNVDGPFPVPSLHYHIFAEPRKKPTERHIKTAFRILASLYTNKLGGLKLSDEILADIDNNPSKLVQDVDGISLPLGFDGIEPMSLEQRDNLKVSMAAVHVGACAGVIVVSGPDA